MMQISLRPLRRLADLNEQVREPLFAMMISFYMGTLLDAEAATLENMGILHINGRTIQRLADFVWKVF